MTVNGYPKFSDCVNSNVAILQWFRLESGRELLWVETGGSPENLRSRL